MLLEFLRWWYGPGLIEAWRKAGHLVLNIEKAFSIGVLFRTLFSPWKRIISVPGSSIGERFKAAADNLVSRTVGFFVRLLTLLAALVVTLLMAIVSYLLAASWPLLPLAILYFIYWGVSG